MHVMETSFIPRFDGLGVHNLTPDWGWMYCRSACISEAICHFHKEPHEGAGALFLEATLLSHTVLYCFIEKTRLSHATLYGIQISEPVQTHHHIDFFLNFRFNSHTVQSVLDCLNALNQVSPWCCKLSPSCSASIHSTVWWLPAPVLVWVPLGWCFLE